MPSPAEPHRYRIDSIAFAPDGRGVMIRYEDPTSVGGPILGNAGELELTLNDDDDMLVMAWDMREACCEMIDRAVQARRLAR